MRSHISSQQFTKEIAPSPHMRKDLKIIILGNEHDEVKKYVQCTFGNQFGYNYFVYQWGTFRCNLFQSSVQSAIGLLTRKKHT